MQLEAEHEDLQKELSAKYGITWKKLHDSCWECEAVARRVA